MSIAEVEPEGWLTGKGAVVTGAGSGIGRAEAHALAAAGAAVAVNDIGLTDDGASRADVVAAEIRDVGGQAVASGADISTLDGGAELIETARDAFGRLDIVVNNAGRYQVGRLEDFSADDWASVVSVNLTGTYGTVRAAAPIFKSQRSGVIVNTSSASGLGLPGQLAYSASKEAVIGLTRSVARELGHFGVRCNAIRPRAQGTEMTLLAQRTLGGWTELRKALGRYAVGEIAPLMAGTALPEHVAPFVAWLCSDLARNVNGRTFLVGGDAIAVFDEPQPVRIAFSPGGWSAQQLADSAAIYLTEGMTDNFALPDRSSDFLDL
jgi:3-oxoacyl-[acyl-carrier protein] reductase